MLDIDGTLVDSQGESSRAVWVTLQMLYPGYAFPRISMAGRTDFGIWEELLSPLRRHRHDFNCFRRRYRRVLAHLLRDRPPRVLPGAADLCREVSANPCIHPILVTGNLPETARAKLEPSGLWHDLHGGQTDPPGGWGTHLPTKVGLACAALASWKARNGQRSLPAVLVGDTQEDAACAREAGIPFVGVLTGRDDESVLHSAGAVLVLPDLNGGVAVLGTLAELARLPA